MKEFRFKHRIRVRWAEVDLQKIVFNAHYLAYLDVAISNYWRELALPYEQTLNSLGGDLFVKKASLEYHASAAYDDMLTLCLKCERMGRSSLTFKGAVYRNETLLVEGELVYVFADIESKKSKAIPEKFKDLLTLYEAGGEISHSRMGTWSDLKGDALSLRHCVFVKEQGVPIEMEEDSYDEDAQHLVLYNYLGLPIATARLVTNLEDFSVPDSMRCLRVAKIGRMAVRKDLRGSHWGWNVLQKMQDKAESLGITDIFIHAQVHAAPFYAKLGFKSVGEEFMEAEIKHVLMHQRISSQA
jgi:YbgC/YbaW family acyl-CoA thioester hydrolase